MPPSAVAPSPSTAAPARGDADALDSPAKRVAEGEPAAGEESRQELPGRDIPPPPPEATGASEAVEEKLDSDAKKK